MNKKKLKLVEYLKSFKIHDINEFRTYFAQKDIKVLASTHNEKKAKMINDGVAPFYEENLQEIMNEIKSEKPELLKCLFDPVEAVLKSDISMITQGTPMHEDKSIYLSFIETMIMVKYLSLISQILK